MKTDDYLCNVDLSRLDFSESSILELRECVEKLRKFSLEFTRMEYVPVAQCQSCCANALRQLDVLLRCPYENPLHWIVERNIVRNTHLVGER